MNLEEILEKIMVNYTEAHALDIDLGFLSCLQEIKDTYCNNA